VSRMSNKSCSGAIPGRTTRPKYRTVTAMLNETAQLAHRNLDRILDSEIETETKLLRLKP